LLQSQKAAADNTVIGEATKLKGRIEAHWSKMVEKELALQHCFSNPFCSLFEFILLFCFQLLLVILFWALL